MDRALSDDRHYGGHYGGGGRGRGRGNRGEWWRGHGDRPRHRGRGRHFRGLGGGQKRRRSDDTPPPQPQGAASVRLVQLFVRVADVWSRSTTDKGTSLKTNIENLQTAVAAKDFAEDPQRTAKLLCLVARSSPGGAKPLGLLAAGLATTNRDAVTNAVDGAIHSAAQSGRRLDLKLAFRLRCALPGKRAAITAVLRALESATMKPLLAEVLLPVALTTTTAISADALKTYMTQIQAHTSFDDEDDLPRTLLEYGAAAFFHDDDTPRLAPIVEPVEEAEEDAGEDAVLLSTLLSSSTFRARPDVPMLPGLIPTTEKLTRREMYLVADTAFDIACAFRVGVKWDGILVGDKASVAKQLLAIHEILAVEDCQDDCHAIVAAVLLGAVAAGRAPDDGTPGIQEEKEEEKEEKKDDAMDVDGEEKAAPTTTMIKEWEPSRSAADWCLDLLHIALELCAQEPKFAAKLAASVELTFRNIDDVDAVMAYRLSVWFAYFLNNTKLAWPYWEYWRTAVDDAPAYDRQLKFLKDLLEQLVRLSYVDRIKCADGFPEDFHEYLPPDPKPVLTNNFLAALGLEGDGNHTDAVTALLDDLLDDEEEEEDEKMEDKKANPLRDLDDDEAQCKTALGAVLETSSATVSHMAAALDRVAAVLGELSRGVDSCEAACLEAVVSVWQSSFHVEFLIDGLLRRGVLRPRAVIAWLFTTATEFGAAKFAETHKPARLIDIAVDRSLDLLTAATAVGGEMLETQTAEAEQVFSMLISNIGSKLTDFHNAPTDDEDIQDEQRNFESVALAILRDLGDRYRRAEKADLEAHRRSSTARQLPSVFQNLDLPDVHPTVRTKLLNF